MRIKEIVNGIVQRLVYGSRRDSQSYVAYLKRLGVTIGEGTIIFDPPSTIIDVQNPGLLSIGRDVRITAKSIILTHDYSWSVIARMTGECLGGVAPVRIGDNVFIGMNAIVLPGTTIGNNVIVGAGSIVSKNLPDDCVCVGSPAKPIMSIEEFREKKIRTLDDRMSAIKEIIGFDSESRNRYLREFAFFDESVQVDRDKLLGGTGYGRAEE